MHIKRIIALHFFIYIFLNSVSAKSTPIDSLEKVLATHLQVDTAKVNLLNKLAYEIYPRNTDKAKSYADQSWKIATELNYPKGQANSLWIVGLTSLRNDKKMALIYFQEALNISRKVNDKIGICNYLMAIGNVSKDLGNIDRSDRSLKEALQIAYMIKDKELIIKTLYNISRSESSKGYYAEAIEKFQKVVEIAQEINDLRMISRAYSNIAFIYNMQGNAPQALEYYLYALKINETLNNKSDIFNNYINIAGIQSDQKEHKIALKTIQHAFRLARKMNNSDMISICLTNIGNIYQRMNHPKALDYLQKALKMVKGNNLGQRINLLVTIGEIYTSQGKFIEAQKSLDEALALAQKINAKPACSDVLIKQGKLYFAQKKYRKAIECTVQGLQISNEIKQIELQKDSYLLLSKIYASTGDYKDAFHYYKLFKELNDSIFNDKNIRKLTLLESTYKHDKEKQKYEMEKTNNQLEIKNQQYFIFFLTIVTLLLFVLSYILYRSNRLKKKVLQLEIEKINNELEYSQKEIASATLKLMQNSESDTYCVKMLEAIENNTAEEGDNSVRALINYYKNKSVYSNWDEFETLFLKVNSGFYDKLNERFPTLTPNERKLCVFLKLNMSNKDIAQITFQSEEALKKARLRLRKKIEMNRDENLTTIIQNL